MNDDQFKIINKKLDQIVGLLANNTIKDKTIQEQVKILDSLEFKPEEIAKIIGKTRNNVDQVLHKIRAKTNKKKED